MGGQLHSEIQSLLHLADECKNAHADHPDWKRVDGDDEGVSTLLHRRYSPPLFLCSTKIDTESPSAVVDMLGTTDMNVRRLWDDQIDELCSVGPVDNATEVVYSRMKKALGGIVSPRDFCTLAHRIDDQDGKAVTHVNRAMELLHPEASSRIPQRATEPGCVRGLTHFTIFHAEQDDKQVNLLYGVQVSLGGMLPSSVVQSGVRAAVRDQMKRVRAQFAR